jgi:hypothetical protein
MSGVSRLWYFAPAEYSKHIAASSCVLSFEVQEAMDQEIPEILSTINLACHNIFVSLCIKSLTLQPWKMEVISLISSQRDIRRLCGLFLGDADETDRFSSGVGQSDLVSRVMPVKA